MISRVVILNDASVARGGATGLALLSLRLLRARGLAVTYIVGDDGVNDELRDLGVEVVPVGGQQLVKQNPVMASARGIYNLKARETIADWIGRNDTPATVYHVHGWSKILSPSIFAALRPVAHRTVVHAHDFFLACPNGAYMDYRRNEVCERVPLGVSCLSTNCDKRNYAQKLWRAGRKRVLNSTFLAQGDWSNVLMIHEKMATYLEKGGVSRERLVTVRNPAQPFRRERIAVEANDTFFFIGRVEAEKGVLELIEAVKTAKVKLAVIGDGPLRSRLELENPDIRFHGWKSGPDIAELLREARGVVMPTRYPEPFGLVAAEASQSGLPILISRTAFLSQEIVQNEIGYAFDLNDPGTVSGALSRLLSLPPPETEAMSRRAHANVAKLSSTNSEWIEQLLGLYEATLAPTASAAESRAPEAAARI